jgi:hypothetical protein
MMHMRLSGFLAVAAIGLLLVAPAAAQGKKDEAVVVYVPTNSNPPVPAGLKATCLQGPDVLTPSKTCPVVKYQGITTWAYSFIDNRVPMALVSYDAQNKVVRNVTKDGARYVWTITSRARNKTVTFEVGHAKQSVSATWAELAGAGRALESSIGFTPTHAPRTRSLAASRGEASAKLGSDKEVGCRGSCAICATGSAASPPGQARGLKAS